MDDLRYSEFGPTRDSPQVSTWVKCKDCDEWWCNLHGKHVFECACPAIEYWNVNPYVE